MTEFVGGGNLTKLIKKGLGISEETVRSVAVDLICSLHYLYSNRVLHRDIKPQNVLLDQNVS